MNGVGALSYRFSKSERLHHRSLVEGLFRNGKSFYEFPFRITWRVMTGEALEKNFRNRPPEGIGKVQMLVTVPKKKRRKAVDRVLMRRRIREAYRLNRFPLYEGADSCNDLATLSLAIVYIHNQNLPYGAIEEKIKIVIEKVRSKLSKIHD